MKARPDIKPGCLFQINPETNTHFGGQIICAEDIYEWGIQGYLFLSLPYENVARFKGRAYLRIKWEDIEPIGGIEWLIQDPEESSSKSDL